MQYFAADHQVSFSEDFESQNLGNFIIKIKHLCSAAKQIFKFNPWQKRQVDL